MKTTTRSIRPFLGCQNFELTRNFYRDLGFEEVVLFHNMSLFQNGALGFYLQDAYVKDWIDNTMVFMEVESVSQFWDEISALDLDKKYENVRLIPIKHESWGSECFLIDPSGILWHFGEFKK